MASIALSTAACAIRRPVAAGDGFGLAGIATLLGGAVVARAGAVIDVRAGVDPDASGGCRSSGPGQRRQLLNDLLAAGSGLAGRAGAAIGGAIPVLRGFAF